MGLRAVGEDYIHANGWGQLKEFISALIQGDDRERAVAMIRALPGFRAERLIAAFDRIDAAARAEDDPQAGGS